MSDEHVTVRFECDHCLGTVLSVSEPVTDDSTVLCQWCGKIFGTWRDVKAKAVQSVAESLGATPRSGS